MQNRAMAPRPSCRSRSRTASPSTAHTTVRFFFFNDTATTEIYTLSLHDALPILDRLIRAGRYWVPQWYKASHWIAYWDTFGRPATKPRYARGAPETWWYDAGKASKIERSEEHTSELQSRRDLVCRLLLEKKNKQ